MHARIDQLLNLRDGEPVDAQVASHVSQCPACGAELHRVATLRRRLRDLPSFEPPSLDLVRRPLPPPSGARSRFVVVAAAGIAALSMVAGWLLSGRGAPEDADIVSVPVSEPAASRPDVDLTELMTRSRRLEEVLSVLPPRPVVERVTTAATIDTLEQRIQWLDFHLSYASEAGLSERQAEHMWRERVDLMDSLVKVRYAESGYMSF